MIAKCTKGRSAYGGLAYDVGPGRAEEHHNPHQIAGSVAGRSWRERAYAMDQHVRAARPGVQRPIHRTALRLADDDRRLTDKEWRQVAERYVTEMNFKDCPWVAMRHGDEHIHVTVCRVQWDGELASDSRDFRRAHQAARVIEREHGLVDASERSNPGRPQVQGGERARAERTGEVAPRDHLRDRIGEAVRASQGTRRGFEAALAERGVVFAANEASTGRMNGYRYGLAGHADAAGEQVWFKGSQLGRDYTWSATQRQLEAQAATPAVGGGREATDAARSVLDRIKGTRDERVAAFSAATRSRSASTQRPGAGHSSNQEPTPRLTTTKGHNVDSETGPVEGTDSHMERRAEPVVQSRKTDQPASEAQRDTQPSIRGVDNSDEAVQEAEARTKARLVVAQMRQKEREQGLDRGRER